MEDKSFFEKGRDICEVVEQVFGFDKKKRSY